jgi:hypothetical protein
MKLTHLLPLLLLLLLPAPQQPRVMLPAAVGGG